MSERLGSVSVNLILAILFALALPAAALPRSLPVTAPADTIVFDGKVWTVDRDHPTAQAVAIRQGRIVRVGTDAEVLKLKGPKTRLIDLAGQTLLPGFNDAHTHFENAVEWYFEARMTDVNSEQMLLERVHAAATRVSGSTWITGGGEWSSAKGNRSLTLMLKNPNDAKYKPYASFEPSLAEVDAVSADHPVFLKRFDGAAFINSKAIAIARILDTTPDPGAGRFGHDAKGHLNGMLYGSAAHQVETMLPPLTLAQKTLGAAGVVKQMNAYGLTSIQDIARTDAITQTELLPANIERSYTDVAIFRKLREQGGLTIRVYAFQPLEAWSQLHAFGLHPGTGDDLLRFGILKDFTDGSFMFEPFHKNPSFSGNWTYRFPGEAEIRKKIIDADHEGWDIGIHVIGDRSLHELIGWYKAAYAANPERARGPRERRFRLIHVEYAQPGDLKDAGTMKLIADVTPYHLTSDTEGLEENLGPERAKYAWAWHTMMEDGVRLNIVSDMPGLYNQSDVGPYDPIENLFYATTRQNLHDEPAGGFHPEQAFTLEQAIEAYTANPAYASHEESLKGTITVGKLADLVVVSGDLLQARGRDILKSKVTMTMLGGRVVYQRP